MFDWDKLHPQGNSNYYPFPNTTPQTDPNPWFPGTNPNPYTTQPNTGGYSYPPHPAKPSCFESKCLNCPYKDKCKNKE